MVHRIFLAIQIPDSIKKDLLSFGNPYEHLPAKWTTEENLHITLLFLGNMSEGEIETLSQHIEKIGETHSPFDICFTHIQYGPSANQPRMIWAMMEESEQLQELQKNIAKEISSSNLPHKPENQSYSPHITLARLQEWRFKRMDLEERPEEIQDSFESCFSIQSFDVVESTLKRNGPTYSVLKSVPLGNSG